MTVGTYRERFYRGRYGTVDMETVVGVEINSAPHPLNSGRRWFQATCPDLLVTQVVTKEGAWVDLYRVSKDDPEAITACVTARTDFERAWASYKGLSDEPLPGAPICPQCQKPMTPDELEDAVRAETPGIHPKCPR